MKQTKKENILKDSERILFHGANGKREEYGDFNECMDDTAKIASIITGKHLTGEDMFKVLIALKLTRLKQGKKEDTFLDLITYTAGLHKYNTDNEQVRE